MTYHLALRSSSFNDTVGGMCFNSHAVATLVFVFFAGKNFGGLVFLSFFFLLQA